jgi:uncharacterized protein YbjT (DUF2867 family)
MKIAIAGGHGKIGLLLGEILAEQGHAVLGLIRDPAQESDLEASGVEPVLCDLEGDDDLSAAVRGADAVVFAAGGGPGSGPERKRTMDLGGALKLIEAAKSEEIHRYLMISTVGADNPPAEGEGDTFGAYLRAKAEADRALVASGLDYTIVRPGPLTDDPPTGMAALGPEIDSGEIPRADVAAVLAAALPARNTIGTILNLASGPTPISGAVASI